MTTLLQDLRYGARTLWSRPGFTLVAVLTLALGIGANAAIFSLVNAVLLKPLPFPDPERLVMIWEDASSIGFPQNTPAPANYIDWKAQTNSFEDMAALQSVSYNLTGAGEPQKLNGQAVTANLFSVLGVAPALGRAFTADEEKPGSARVVILSHALWRDGFGGGRSVVGSEILLNGEKYTVAGVMPAGFQLLQPYIHIWVPLAQAPEDWANRGGHYLNVVARTKPGVSVEQADADIKTVMARISRDHPDEAEGLGAFVQPLRDQLAGDVRRPLMMLLVAVAFVLLISCANIAGLLLSRSVARRREIAIRVALGASRWRVVRQLLTESALLSLLGGGLGLLLALWSFAFLQQLIPPTMALSAGLSVDGRVLGFTLLVSLVTGTLFGLAPAVAASNAGPGEALKAGGGGRGGTASGGRRLRNAFVVAEVALALVLLVGAGLLIQSLQRLQGQYSVIKPENVLTLRTILPPNSYTEHSQRLAFYDGVLARVRSLPGVVSAGYTTTVPLTWKGGTSGLTVEGRPPARGLQDDANHRQVTADYLQALGLPLKAGRYLEGADGPDSQPVAVVNEAMARAFWPGGDAVGKRFKIGGPASPRPWLTVVGVVGDIRQMGLDAPAKPEMYLPYPQVNYQEWFAPGYLVIRTSVEPQSLVAAVRREVYAVDPTQPVSNVQTMAEILGEESAQRRVGMTLLAVFAGLALALASLGIYGVLSFFVAQHTQEIGVRLALGAQPRSILALVLRRGMGLALLGVGVGLVGAFALTRLMQSQLFEVSATDPLTYAGLALLLTAVALFACLIPARRATKVDPLVALRYE
ncbi:MAG TPA: ABC transporter permease [Pyrinomonadaceae bacterium]|nr:ABC transporter permease [Pyrinomonadaceae bacterium]